MSREARHLVVRIVGGGPFSRPVEVFQPLFRPPGHPKAVALRQTYRLLETAGEGGDFDRARRLMNWVRRQWNHGYDVLPADQDDALALLAAARQGMSFQCGDYATALVQCCQATGIVARHIYIKRREADFPYRCEGNSGHHVTEAYCRDLRGWVLLDPDVNAFYLRDGKPASALDLHLAWHRDRGRGVQRVLDGPAFVRPATCPGFAPQQVASWFRDFNRHQTLHFYHYLFTRLVHGYTGEERRRFPDRRLAYTGVALPYLALNGREVPFDSHLAVIRADQFDWPMNRTYVQARMIGAKPSRRIEARLQHTMPFFDHFEVAAGDGGWRRIQGDTFRLVLPAARTRFRGRCVDCFGLPGHDAGLRTEVRPKA